MNRWRISKYNPKFRKHGAYQKDDWTSVSEIGKSFQGSIFTLQQYLDTEDRYVSVVLSFLRESGLSSLTVKNLEKDLPRPPQVVNLELADLLQEMSDLQEGELSPVEIEKTCRVNLRELIWCKLEKEQLFYVHFGRDYYMYIGSALSCPRSVSDVSSVGLFIEEFPSPYE
jgi:hypothetical protein